MGISKILDGMKNLGNEKFAAEIDKIKTAYEQSKGSCTVVTYSEDEREIVRSGIESIDTVLFSDDKDRMRRLLFCLDMYLDPYYGYDLPYEKDIFTSLQRLLTQTDDYDIAKDITDLLMYCDDCSLIWENIDLVNEEFRDYVRSELFDV